ncbi:sensor domain-containing diguanylate cyclase [Kordiimonas gwangyangensis]|uniref:sensor domain-containing diguanylate cyclase n=1 Tax=Kordiimonas gwangyangensis TaxID=288022 RepID=UPI0009DABA76|nr:diguanylate cyclase [Kordiimonas gwangyangensis]
MTIRATLKVGLGLGTLALLLLTKVADGPVVGSILFTGAVLMAGGLTALLIRENMLAAAATPGHKAKIDPDALPDAVIVSSVNGGITVLNRSAFTLFDLDEEPTHIKTLFEDWHRMLTDRSQADQVVEAVLASPDIQFSEMLYLADGRTVERTTRPVPKKGERLWILRDITHMQLADSDSAMHRSMVEADAARTAELAEQLYHAKAELEAKQAELTRLANTDSLTGLLNRRRFTALGEKAVTDATMGSEIWVVMMDIDHFKRINDTYGHAAGDVAIRDFANIVSEAVGERGFVGRMGGEEFAVILPGFNQDETITLAEKIRRATAHHQTVSDNEKFRFTASVGVAQWMPREVTIEPALDRADQALYSAKAYGRNRVVGFEYASV